MKSYVHLDAFHRSEANWTGRLEATRTAPYPASCVSDQAVSTECARVACIESASCIRIHLRARVSLCQSAVAVVLSRSVIFRIEGNELDSRLRR